jgi:tol-pal system protein YbgF
MTAMRRIAGLSLLVVSLAAAADSPAPGTPEDRCFQALQSRQDDLSARMARLEDQSGSQGILSLLNQVETLETEVARLRGALDEIAHKQQIADKRQKDVLADFDARIKENHDQLARVTAQTGAGAPADAAAAPGSATQGAAVAPDSAAPAVDSEAETKAYEAAFNLLKTADYKAAVPAFNSFLRQYPNGSLAGNAMYWLGLSYFSLADYKNTVATQQQLLKAYPQHAKVPDAMVSMARAYIQLGEADKANQMLTQVVAKYPTTPAADMAKRIQSLLK